jgi:hypothetical protein
MRGKYITTSIRLAVLAGSKKTIKTKQVKETAAVINNYQPMWVRNCEPRIEKATQENCLAEAV